jgi:hypothetical protein
MTQSVEAFLAGLVQLGYAPVVVADKPDHVTFEYVVESGRFAGRKVQLGIVVPVDFPATPPGGPHVSPHIHALGQPGGHPAGAVHASTFGSESQYWSRPFPGWAQSKRTVATYMSHVWRLWDSQ